MRRVVVDIVVESRFGAMLDLFADESKRTREAVQKVSHALRRSNSSKIEAKFILSCLH